YYHLWFLYVIIGLYFMAPFLRILVKHMTKTTFQVFLLFWFLYAGVLPFAQKFLHFEPALTAGLFEPYIGYFLLGAYLVLYPLPKKMLLPLFIVSTLSYFATIYGTHALTAQKGELD